MLQASRQTMKIASAASFFDLLLKGAAHLLAPVQKRRRLAHNQRILEQLSDAQLEDAGIDRWAIRQPRPAVEVEAGLMTKLMSMR
jgi:uncharacterized protein YjiS (DUF1127 family)